MKKLAVLVLSLVSTSAFSGSETGTVTFQNGQHQSDETFAGYTFFVLQGGTRANPPPCATAMAGERWVINNGWPAARIQINVLLLAAATGKQVAVLGSGDCAVWADSETAVDVFLVE